MLSLNLEVTSQQRHLEKNAGPHLRAISAALTEISAAVKSFRGTHDNRRNILKGIASLMELGEALEGATDEDLTAKEAEAQLEQRRTLLLDQCRRINNATPHLFTEEEGTKPLRKRVAAKLLSLQTDLRISDLDPEFCESAARDAELVHGWISDILVIDERLDRWQPNMMLTGCTALAKTLRSAIPRTAEPLPAAQTVNTKVQNLLPYVDSLQQQLGGLGRTEHGGSERVEPILADVRQLRKDLHSRLFEAVDFTEVRSRVVHIQADLRALDRIPSLLGDNVTFHFFHAESKYAHHCIVELLKAIPMDQEQPLATTAQIAKGGLSWAS